MRFANQAITLYVYADKQDTAVYYLNSSSWVGIMNMVQSVSPDFAYENAGFIFFSDPFATGIHVLGVF